MKMLLGCFAAFMVWFYWPLMVTSNAQEEAEYLLRQQPEIVAHIYPDTDTYRTITPVAAVANSPFGNVFVDYNGGVPAIRVMLYTADEIPLGTKMCLRAFGYHEITSSSVKDRIHFAQPC